MPSTTSRALALLIACAPLTLAACTADVPQKVGGSIDPPKTEPPQPDPPRGELVWSRTYGGEFDDSANVLTLTPDDHAIFAGRGPLDGSTEPAEARTLIMGVDGAGTLTAHQRIGDDSYYLVGVQRTAVGPHGELLVAGRFAHASSIAGCPLASPLGFGGEYLAALDEQGACLWATAFAASAMLSSLDVSSTGEIVLAGTGKPGASLGGGVTLPTPAQGGARFYARFSSTGAPLSAHGIETLEVPIVRFDQDGGLIVATRTALVRKDAQGAADWSLEIPEEEGIRELVVAGSRAVRASWTNEGARLSSIETSGEASSAWSLDILGASPGLVGPPVLGAGVDGTVVVATRVTGAQGVSIGKTLLATPGNDNLLWALIDDEGAVIRSKIVPFEATVYPSAVAENPAGDVWILGTFTGSADFGDGVHPGHLQPPPKVWSDPTGYDVFLARYH